MSEQMFEMRHVGFKYVELILTVDNNKLTTGLYEHSDLVDLGKQFLDMAYELLDISGECESVCDALRHFPDDPTQVFSAKTCIGESDD